MITFTWNDVPEPYDNISQVESLEFTPPFSFTKDQNYFIAADNYPALQKLAPRLKEKIDIIYIDPPYNTGNNFAYNDKFARDEWLSFMSRRLRLAKDAGSKHFPHRSHFLASAT